MASESILGPIDKLYANAQPETFSLKDAKFIQAAWQIYPELRRVVEAAAECEPWLHVPSGVEDLPAKLREALVVLRAKVQSVPQSKGG